MHFQVAIVEDKREALDLSDFVDVAAETPREAALEGLRIQFQRFGKPAGPVRLWAHVAAENYPRHKNGLPMVLDSLALDCSPETSQELEATADWAKINRRRAALIEQSLSNSLSEEQRVELAKLQSLAELRRRLVAPLPIQELETRYRELTAVPESTGSTPSG